MSREFRHLASFIVNVVLAATVVVMALRKPERAPAPSSREASPGKMADQTPVVAIQPRLPQYADIGSASDRRRWLVDQLRAAGVPNNVLARVVLSDFEEGWQKRFEESTDKGNGDADSMAALQL